LLSAVKGMNDILPDRSPLWRQVEATARRVFGLYGFEELRTPVLERTEVFCRMGADTDVVEKQMYTFEDKSGTSVTLRPEATASVMRAVIEAGLLGREPIQKLYSIGPMFRYERPQKGRYRQFHQINVERLGEDGPFADAETLAMAYHFACELGLAGVKLEVNSLGCPECRGAYKQALQAIFEGKADELCEDCKRRRHTNPLRVLDCKVESCKAAVQGVPAIEDYLCDDCRGHYAATLAGLDQLGVVYEKNPMLVRGLDYYTRTTFEMTASSGLGSQNAIAGGGRYDGLVSQLGGPETPGIGFAFGFERLIMLLEEGYSYKPAGCFVVCQETARAAATQLIGELRQADVRVEAVPDKGFKAQMKRAGKSGYQFCLILGETEVEAGTVMLKDLESGAQESVARAAIAARLNELLAPAKEKI